MALRPDLDFQISKHFAGREGERVRKKGTQWCTIFKSYPSFIVQGRFNGLQQQSLCPLLYLEQFRYRLLELLWH